MNGNWNGKWDLTFPQSSPVGYTESIHILLEQEACRWDYLLLFTDNLLAVIPILHQMLVTL